MGFWGTLGKYALKAAPYAAMAIPGVGVPLGMAMAGGMGVANKKLQGGSWKDSLISGGIDAGVSAIPGGGALTGIGPTAKAVGKTTAKSVLGNMGKNIYGGIKEGAFDNGSQQQPMYPGQTPGYGGGYPGSTGINGGTFGRTSPGMGGTNQGAAIMRGQPQMQQPQPQYQQGGVQPQYQTSGPNQPIGPSQNPANWRYSGEDVGHEGKTAGGLSREQWRDKWMSSGTSNITDMDAWLRANGGQRMNDSGIVRTPFGEALDMGTAYRTGRGTPGWTPIPGVDAANIPVIQQQQMEQQPQTVNYQQGSIPQQQQQLIAPTQTPWMPSPEQLKRWAR